MAKGVAWTVPAVMVAGAAPAFAVSPGEVTMELVSVACKLPGASCLTETGVKKGYAITAKVCNFTTKAVKVTVRDGKLSMNGGATTTWEVGLGSSSLPTSCATWIYVTDPDDPTDNGPGADGNNNGILRDVELTLAAGTATTPTCCNISFGFEGTSSSNVTLSGTVPYSWVSTDGTLTGPAGQAMTVYSATTPPCSNCLP